MLATDRLPTHSEERDALIGAAVEAGHAVMPMFRDGAIKRWSKADDSPVSEADMRANQVLQEALIKGPRRNYGWLSEESTDDPSRLERPRTIIVDPIDGTRAFLRGEDSFTVCLSICDGGQAIASVVYAPARDEIFAAAKGEGATLNGRTISASTCAELRGCRMIGQKRMFGHPRWPTPWPSMSIQYRNSTSYRMAMVAAGRADATIALLPKPDWDTAPGALIVAEAGGKVSDHLGRDFRFCREEPEQPGLVCAAAPLYPHIIERLGHLPSDLRTLKP